MQLVLNCDYTLACFMNKRKFKTLQAKGSPVYMLQLACTFLFYDSGVKYETCL